MSEGLIRKPAAPVLDAQPVPGGGEAVQESLTTDELVKRNQLMLMEIADKLEQMNNNEASWKIEREKALLNLKRNIVNQNLTEKELFDLGRKGFQRKHPTVFLDATGVWNTAYTFLWTAPKDYSVHRIFASQSTGTYSLTVRFVYPNGYIFSALLYTLADRAVWREFGEIGMPVPKGTVIQFRASTNINVAGYLDMSNGCNFEQMEFIDV